MLAATPQDRKRIRKHRKDAREQHVARELLAYLKSQCELTQTDYVAGQNQTFIGNQIGAKRKEIEWATSRLKHEGYLTFCRPDTFPLVPYTYRLLAL